MDYDIVSRQTIIRLPSYLNYLKNLTNDRYPNISATIIANALGLNDVQVRKDLSVVSSAGKPKVGYNREEGVQTCFEVTHHGPFTEKPSPLPALRR